MLSQQFGAWVAAAITALSIQLQALSAPAIDMVNFISDPINLVYTNSEQGLESYLNQSTISITPNGTIIDDEVYDDVWLSHDAAEIFRTNAFDFSTAYSIASNTNGTFASGVGFSQGATLFNVNGVRQSQLVLFPCEAGTYTLFGDLTVTVSNINDVGGYKVARLTLSNGNTWYGRIYDNTCGAIFRDSNPLSEYATLNVGNGTPGSTIVSPGFSEAFPFISQPFDFDYVSGTIPAEQEFDEDDGLLIHIPHHSGTSHLSEFIDENPEFAEPGGIEIDPTIDPDIHTKLGDLINIIAPLIPVINAEYAPAPVAPVPVPDDTIADTLFSELSTILNNIIQTIASIPTAISALGDRILEDIELGPIRVYQKVLDLFRTIFAPVINLITAGIGIWSYVVSWLSAISLPFNFVLSIVPSGIMIPIYASIAGWLVIAIFRRFGR